MCDKEPFSGYSTDIWASGVVLYIFLTGKLPFFSENPTILFDMISKEAIKFPSVGDECLAALKMVLDKDPLQRASIGTLLNTPYCDEAKTSRHGSEIGDRLKLTASGKTVSVSDVDVKDAIKERSIGYVISEKVRYGVA